MPTVANKYPCVLIADDRDLAREAIKSALEIGEPKLSVFTVKTVERAIELLTKQREGAEDVPDFAVVIIDLNFEKSDGAKGEAAGMQILREALKVPFLEAVILTAYPSINTASEAVRLGAFRYVIKGDEAGTIAPSTPLKETVRLALETRNLNIALKEDLTQLRRAIGELGQGHVQDYATNVLYDAEQIYRRILSARGKSPDQKS